MNRLQKIVAISALVATIGLYPSHGHQTVCVSTSLHRAVELGDQEKVSDILELLECQICMDSKTLYKTCLGTASNTNESSIHRLCGDCYEHMYFGGDDRCPSCRGSMPRVPLLDLEIFGGINLYNENGLTALDLAQRSNNQGIAKILVENGAQTSDVLINNILAQAPALMSQSHNESVADPRETQNEAWMEAIVGNDMRTIENLIIDGAYIDQAIMIEGKRTTALCLAATLGYARLVNFLLDRGALTFLSDQDGKTPLQLSIEHDQIEVVKQLIYRGLDFQMVAGMAVMYGSDALSKTMLTFALDNRLIRRHPRMH